MAINQELKQVRLVINEMLAAKKKQITYKQESEKGDVNHDKVDYWMSKLFVLPNSEINFPTEIEEDENLYRAVLRRILLMLAQRILYHAQTSLDKGRLASAIRLYCATDGSMATYFALRNEGMSLQAAKATLAKMGGLAKLAADPKQQEKSFIYNCWQSWQKKTDSYKSKAAFARDMLTKCEHLTSQKKIEDWCREWEKANPAG